MAEEKKHEDIENLAGVLPEDDDIKVGGRKYGKYGKSEAQEKQIKQHIKDNNVYSYVRWDKTTRKLWVIMAVVILIFSSFIAGLYFVNLYSVSGDMVVEYQQHDHVYSVEEATYVDGNCQEYGFTIYHCTVEFCDTQEVVYDIELGNCRYNTAPEEVTIDGVDYYVYTCSICGKLNYMVKTS